MVLCPFAAALGNNSSLYMDGVKWENHWEPKAIIEGFTLSQMAQYFSQTIDLLIRKMLRFLIDGGSNVLPHIIFFIEVLPCRDI